MALWQTRKLSFLRSIIDPWRSCKVTFFLLSSLLSLSPVEDRKIEIFELKIESCMSSLIPLQYFLGMRRWRRVMHLFPLQYLLLRKRRHRDVSTQTNDNGMAATEAEVGQKSTDDPIPAIARVDHIMCAVDHLVDMVKGMFIRTDHVEKLIEEIAYRLSKIEEIISAENKVNAESYSTPNLSAMNTTNVNPGSYANKEVAHIMSQLRDPLSRREAPRNKIDEDIKPDITKVIFQVSDDDDDSDEANRDCSDKVFRRSNQPKVNYNSSAPDARMPISNLKTKNTLNEPNPSNSNFRRGFDAKAKRLSFTPLPAARPNKFPKYESATKVTPKKTTSLRFNPCKKTNKAGKSDMGIDDKGKSKERTNNDNIDVNEVDDKYTGTHGYTMPAYIDCKFRPTVDMELDPYSVTLCAFIWHPDTDPNEIIMKVGDTIGTRKDFDSLCPGRRIPAKMITWMSLKATSIQKRVTEQTIWSLPPSFARDMINGATIEELVNTYVNDWMGPYVGLKYIYIPIEERPSGHWFLGIISIEEQIIYHFDTNIDDNSVESRRDCLMKLCIVIAQIVATDAYPPNFLKGIFNSNSWECAEPRGVPYFKQSKNSEVWVMKWLDMEHCFTANQVGIVHERAIRMKLALALLQGGHNQCWAEFAKNAEAFWEKVKLPKRI